MKSGIFNFGLMERTEYKIYFDGACSNAGDGNMGIGLYILRNGEFFYEAFYNGGIGKSNVAEWMGCVVAMKAGWLIVKQEPESVVKVYSDSQLIVNQKNGTWQIKARKFLFFKDRADYYSFKMGKAFKGINWIRREFNKDADRLSKKGRKLQHRTLFFKKGNI